MMLDYDQEKVTMKKEVKELRVRVERCERVICNVDAWAKAIRKYAELGELTRNILIELVESIDVFEPKKVDKQRVCRIRINYRFVGDISKALSAPDDESESVKEGRDILG